MMRSLLVILGLLCACAASAKTLPTMNFPMNGNAFVVFGATGTVTHTAQLPATTNWAVYHNTPQLFYSFINTIELDQLETTALTVDFDYSLKITGTLKYWVLGSTTPVSSAITLAINSSPAGKTARRLDYYSYSNAYKSELTIQTVTLTTTGTMTPAALYAAVSRVVELNFGVRGTTFSAPAFSTAPTFYTACPDATTNELVVSWNPVGFAEEYELEIAFKDNYADHLAASLPASAIPYDFKENSTRIVTRQTFYRIPLVYPRGYLLYRVRAVGMGGPDWDKRLPCQWSGPTAGMVATFQDRYGPFAAHVGDKMNWQATTTYSDEGKRKDVVQYYDGLYMSRQTVTGVSQRRSIFTQNPGTPLPSGCAFHGSDKIKEIVAQETIYDFNGRPAMQILPTPTGTHVITYIPKLNKNQAGQSYSWKDFDVISNCLLKVQPLSDDASGALGAGAYYAPTNPNKVGYNAFIPDSKGFPFSRVQYVADNTGRTYRQGGVGDIYQLEGGHETKFYYAKPNQVELDRMFGNEVGYAERYQKNMVADPNGQVSVSYLNPEGKTIATALAGNKPDNLLPLDNEDYPPEVIPVDLLAANVPDTLDHSLTINEQFVVPKESKYTFSYNVKGATLDYSSCEKNHICLDCIYDLDISLVANEGCSTIPVFSYSGTFGDLIKETGGAHIDLDCYDAGGPDPLYADRPNNFPTTFSKTLAAGSYTLVKTLRVNRAAADAYVSLVFKDTCRSVLAKFIKEETDKIDTLACFQSCSTCQAANQATPTNCDALCPQPMNECDRARHSMLLDVSPHGQYGEYDITTVNSVTVYDASHYPLSVFNPNSALPGNPNWHNVPGATDLQTLILNWDKATSPAFFLPFHPEYCMLQWCDNQNTGKNYDLKLSETTTYAAAIAANVLTAPSAISVHRQLLAHDPFFASGWGSAQAAAFGAFLDNVCNHGASIRDLAMDAAYCLSQPGFQNILANAQSGSQLSAATTNPPEPPCTIPPGYHTSHVFGSDPATRDAEWRILRDLYETYKEAYLYRNRTDYAVAHGCFNGCIGSENYFFSPFNPPAGYNGSSWSNEGRIGVNHGDPCGLLEFLYEAKVKRFPTRYDAYRHSGVDLTGIDLYGCLTPAQIAGMKSQVAGVVDEYICDTCASCPANGASANGTSTSGTSTSASSTSPVFTNAGTMTVASLPCWLDDLTQVLNQNLPGVTAMHPVTIGADRIPASIRNMAFPAARLPITRITMEYLDEARAYRIALAGDGDRALVLSIPTAAGRRDTAKPLAGVCCVRAIDTTTLGLSLRYADGAVKDVRVFAASPLPICPPVVVPPKHDSCRTLNPLTTELFALLNRLKGRDFPQSGTYVAQGTGHGLDHLLGGAFPTQYAMDPRNCSLTFSATTPPSGGGLPERGPRISIPLDTGRSIENTPTLDPGIRIVNDPRMYSESPRASDSAVRITNGAILDTVNTGAFSAGPRINREVDNGKLIILNPNVPYRPKIPPPCTITFEDCGWMSPSATLVSIKPYFPTGQGNVRTNEFILTYLRFTGDRIDTVTVCGASTCFSINECHKPYFCDQDTVQRYTPPPAFNGCVQAQVLTAAFMAHERYGKWLDSMKNDLRRKYYARCMQAGEQAGYTYLDELFHFTLYYYDQGGNLVRTVPPAGVRLLHASQAPAINQRRDNPASGPPILPVNAYVTNYANNSLNQTVWQITPDAGKSTFLYDKIGRIVASQNAVQRPLNFYSYTWYDELGRIVESGKMKLGGPLSAAIVSNYKGWKTFLYGLPRTEITYTQYDVPFSPAVSGKFPGGQANLRGRVASVLSFEDGAKQAAGSYRHATEYTYDVTGNVPILIQDYPNTPLGDKVIAYNFDLLTGKVNEVRYAPGEPDELRHSYKYDDGLRLISVATSHAGIFWETDAEYSYYRHGPLARTELGTLNVQGLDYLYTLQGWIKGVNGTTETRDQDAGRDGIALEQPGPAQTVTINGQAATVFNESNPTLNAGGPGYHSLHNPVAADAFGYVLAYYPGDYSPIVPPLNPAAGMNAVTGNVKPLYNGNIGRMYTWLQGLGGLGMNYRYDQLNRIKEQEAFTIAPGGAQALLANNAYRMELTYDGSGNIISMLRNGTAANPKMDNLQYHYLNAAGGVIANMAHPPANATNRLAYVDDNPGYTGNYPETTPTNGTVTDIDDQSIGNYGYDFIGNLVRDKSEHIKVIKWNLQNKITEIDKTDGSRIDFAYDALGNRIYKKYVAGSLTPNPNPFPAETYYVRDAKGNIRATYEVKGHSLILREQNIYGTSRLGVWHPNIPITAPGHGLAQSVDWQNIRPLSLAEDSTIRGSRQYELSNHLGNVLVTVSDKRIQVAPSAGASGVLADVLSAGDYYAFGMGMPGRKSSGLIGYRFGYNGKENDGEAVGTGEGTQDYGMRIYNPSIAKFFGVDPLSRKYPELTPYQFASNRPIQGSDIDGKEFGEEVLAIWGMAELYTLAFGSAAITGVVVAKEVKRNPAATPFTVTNDLPGHPAAGLTTSTEPAWNGDKNPADNTGDDPVNPQLPKGGSDLGKAVKAVVIAVMIGDMYSGVEQTRQGEADGQPQSTLRVKPSATIKATVAGTLVTTCRSSSVGSSLSAVPTVGVSATSPRASVGGGVNQPTQPTAVSTGGTTAVGVMSKGSGGALSNATPASVSTGGTTATPGTKANNEGSKQKPSFP